MKELTIEPQAKLKEKIYCSLEVVVSEKNLITMDELESNTRQIFSQFQNARVKLLALIIANERVQIKIEVKNPEESDFLLGALDTFLHYLGNVRVYHKKVDYRVVS